MDALASDEGTPATTACPEAGGAGSRVCGGLARDAPQHAGAGGREEDRRGHVAARRKVGTEVPQKLT